MKRQLFFSIAVVGMVVALAGAGAISVFSDTERSANNTLRAGTLDLTIDWTENYNGGWIETQEFTDDPGAVFELEDVKPGDWGEATISLHIDNNDAWMELKIGNLLNEEEGMNEPEMKVDDSPDGELAQNLDLVIWDDDGNNVLEDGEDVWFRGDALDLPERICFGALEGGENHYVGIKWSVDKEVGNIIQSDMVQFDMIFAASQRRHVSESPYLCPENNILLVDSPTSGNVGDSPYPDADSDLYAVSLDKGAGEATLSYVDNLGENFPNVDALASSIDGEEVYAVDKTTKHLGMYDMSSGTFTDLGELESYPGGEVLLAMSTTDVLYLASESDDSLYTVDTATPTTSLVGDTGIDLSGSDMAFNADGVLYTWTNNAEGSNPAGFYRLNTTTGAATLIASRNGGIGFSVTGMAIDNAGFGDVLVSEASNDQIHVIAPDGTVEFDYEMVGDLTDHISGDMAVRELIDP